MTVIFLTDFFPSTLFDNACTLFVDAASTYRRIDYPDCVRIGHAFCLKPVHIGESLYLVAPEKLGQLYLL